MCGSWIREFTTSLFHDVKGVRIHDFVNSRVCEFTISWNTGSWIHGFVNSRHYAHAFINMCYAHACMHMACTRTRTHTHTCMAHAHACTCTCMHTHTHTQCMHMHMHAHACTHMHMHAHAHAHAHTHTHMAHTHACYLLSFLLLCIVFNIGAEHVLWMFILVFCSLSFSLLNYLRKPLVKCQI